MANLKQPKGLIKGAVLLMILTIMFVLIIILMATLTVVSTASKRTYQKFEQNQSEFTARSCVEYYIGNILKNSKTGTYIAANNDPYFVTAPTATMTVGRDAELELRTLKSLDCDGSSALPVTDPKYHEDNNEAGLYSDTKTSPMSGYTDYSAAKESVKYNIKLPKVANASDAFGKLSDDTDGDGFADATIEVFVLDRQFDKGSGATLTEQIANGNRAKDKYTIRIVAKAAFNDYISTVVAIYETNENPPIWNNAITSFNTITLSGAKMNILGGSAACYPGSQMERANDCIVYGTTYYEGSLKSNTNTIFGLGSKDVFYVSENGSFGNSARIFSGVGVDATASDYDDATMRPTVYFGGLLDLNASQLGIGCGSSTSGSPGPSDYASAVASNGTSDQKATDVIAGGGLKIKGAYINGDLYVNGDLDMAQWSSATYPFSVSGDVFVDGNIINVADAKVTDFTANVSGTVNVSGTAVSSGTSIPLTVTPWAGGNDWDIASVTANGKVTLPSGDERNMPTYGRQYYEFYEKENFSPYDPKIPLVQISAQDMAETDATGLKEGNYGNDPWISGATPLGSDISALNAGGDFVLVPGTWYSGTATITSDKTVRIWAPPGNYTWSASLYSTETANAAAGTPIKLGNNQVPGPKVFFYFDSTATTNFELTQNTGNPLITGFMYAPSAKLYGNAKGVSMQYLWKNSATPETKQIAIAGSAVFGDIDLGDTPTIAYLPADPTATAGKTSLTWKLKYYTRNEESEGLST